MVAKKPKVVIIGAGMAGLTAASRLYTCSNSRELFDLCVVEGGTRIGGRINTTNFCGDNVELGATWIHGVGGSPVHKIAQEIGSLQSDQPWEYMDGLSDPPKIMAEGGYEISPPIFEPVSSLFNKLMDFAQGKAIENGEEDISYPRLCNGDSAKLSIGSFLRNGLDAYWSSRDEDESRMSLEEGIFAMHENIQRTFTSADDLMKLDYEAESEYRMLPGDEITIAKGYSSVIESIASHLPPGLVQLGQKVTKIEWQPESDEFFFQLPVKLHFNDGSVMFADHVIVTVSLGVLKAGIRENSGLFNPQLPHYKTEAISRLGFGVVNKLFLKLNSTHKKSEDSNRFPSLKMVFNRVDSEKRKKEIPWWMRRTASLYPIYKKSSVLLAWFAGREALEIESLGEGEIADGVSATLSSFLPPNSDQIEHRKCNGDLHFRESSRGGNLRFEKVLKTQWGTDPLFLGSYSYVAVGSSGDDLDLMAQPLPTYDSSGSSGFALPLQILFAGEATHRTHYSTTHGAYFSGLREANRLLQHYNCSGV